MMLRTASVAVRMGLELAVAAVNGVEGCIPQGMPVGTVA